MTVETWRIWVCGCQGIVHDPEIAEDIEPVTCSHCRLEIRQVEVAEAPEGGPSDGE